MQNNVDKAARITGPRAAADATALQGVQRLAVSQTNLQVTLPTDPNGAETYRKSTLGSRFIRILAMGCDVQWAEGQGSAPTLVYNQAAAVGTGDTRAGATLPNGIPDQLMLGKETTHLAFICASGQSGFVEFYVSDHPVP